MRPTEATAFLIDRDRAEPVAHDLSLSALQATVGGYIEAAFTVPGPTRGRCITAYVNDCGAIDGLPVTALYRLDGMSARYSGAPLCGPVLVCALGPDAGDTVALTPDELDWVEQRLTLLAAIGRDGETFALHLLNLA